MAKTGRPRIEVDWKTVDGLLKIQCTGEEIASFMDIAYDTIERRCKDDHKMGFADYSRLKREGGKPSLRRAQWMLAVDEKNPTMCIWLGKQMLGQKDQVHSEFGGGVKLDHKWTVEVVDADASDS